MASDVKLLSACPDTLVLNVYPTNTQFQRETRAFPVDLKEELDVLKHQAQEDEVQVFLIVLLGEYIMLQPSSLDLAADVLFLDVGSLHDVKRHFVTRAQLTGQRPSTLAEDGMLDGPDAILERWGRLTGLPFGARNGAVSALLYDKTHEIKYHAPDKGYMWDLWQMQAEQQGFCLLKTATVWRIEIRFKRPAFNEMKQEGIFHGIDDAYDLESHLAGLWAYAVGHAAGGEDGLPDGWLRYVLPSEDTNRSRWSVHPDWQVIQTAFITEALPELSYEREEREKEALLQEVDDYVALHPLGQATHAQRLASPADSETERQGQAKPSRCLWLWISSPTYASENEK